MAENLEPIDDLREEYDFSGMEGGVRGKYADEFLDGVTMVTLDPDVAQTFPDAKSVNEALRTLTRIVHERGIVRFPPL